MRQHLCENIPCQTERTVSFLAVGNILRIFENQVSVATIKYILYSIVVAIGSHFSKRKPLEKW